jgi:hypothetical protein
MKKKPKEIVWFHIGQAICYACGELGADYLGSNKNGEMVRYHKRCSGEPQPKQLKIEFD